MTEREEIKDLKSAVKDLKDELARAQSTIAFLRPRADAYASIGFHGHEKVKVLSLLCSISRCWPGFLRKKILWAWCRAVQQLTETRAAQIEAENLNFWRGNRKHAQQSLSSAAQKESKP